MLNGYKGDDLVSESRREKGLYHFVSSVLGVGCLPAKDFKASSWNSTSYQVS